MEKQYTPDSVLREAAERIEAEDAAFQPAIAQFAQDERK